MNSMYMYMYNANFESYSVAQFLKHFLSFWVSEGNVRVDCNWLQSFLLNQCLLDLVQCIFVLDNLESFPFIKEGLREGREDRGRGGGEEEQ